MTWINPLDKVPQLRSDYANHVFYGGLLGFGVSLAVTGAHHFGHLLPIDARLSGLLVTLGVAGGKKLADFLMVGPPTESAAGCILKTLVTALVPAMVYAGAFL